LQPHQSILTWLKQFAVWLVLKTDSHSAAAIINRAKANIGQHFETGIVMFIWHIKK
jgi:hypothetical protein